MKKRELKRIVNNLERKVTNLTHSLTEAHLCISGFAEREEHYKEAIDDLEKDLQDSENLVEAENLIIESFRNTIVSRKNLRPMRCIYSKKNKETIVLWNDGTKTTAICNEKDKFDERAGFYVCYLKKYMSYEAFNDAIINMNFEMIDRDKVHKEREKAKEDKDKDAETA